MTYGDEWPKKYDLSTLRVIGSVGEPINPEAWRWCFYNVGKGMCSIVDTYWQTETGGHVLSPFPGATVTKPGCAMVPFFGIEPAIVDPQTGEEKKGNGVCGVLCLKRSWPGNSSFIARSPPLSNWGLAVNRQKCQAVWEAAVLRVRRCVPHCAPSAQATR